MENNQFSFSQPPSLFHFSSMTRFTSLLVIGLITISSMFPAAAGRGSEAGKHHKHDLGGRVVGGEVAPGPPMYVVSIENYDPRGNYWYHNCGGSILTSTVIITACHCITTTGDTDESAPLMNPRHMRVVAGVVDRRDHSSNRQTVNARAVEKHPQCQMPFVNDVAVVILEADLKFTPRVQPVRVFSRNEQEAKAELQRLTEHNHVCSSGGWGKTFQGGQMSEVLKISRPHLVNNQMCRDYVRYKCYAEGRCGQNIRDFHHTCVQDPNSTNCQGDSGDALICNDYLFGVFSNMPITCRPGEPFVFADISSILYFVNKYA